MAEIRKLQVWTHRADRTREFFVLNVTEDTVRGWDYHTDSSRTRTKTLDPSDLLTNYILTEDTQAAPHV